MDRRLQLQKRLEEILGSRNVYFQPPNDLVLKYPCIVYHLEGGTTRFADNNPYRFNKRYQVTYITRDTRETEIPEKLAMMHMTTLNNWNATNGLNHYNYTTYM